MKEREGMELQLHSFLNIDNMVTKVELDARLLYPRWKNAANHSIGGPQIRC